MQGSRFAPDGPYPAGVEYTAYPETIAPRAQLFRVKSGASAGGTSAGSYQSNSFEDDLSRGVPSGRARNIRYSGDGRPIDPGLGSIPVKFPTHTVISVCP